MKHSFQNPRRRSSMMHAPWLLVALLFVVVPLSAGEAGTPKTIRLLTVGNSFSHNATHYLGDLARAGGDTLILREDNVGGASMEVHWSKVQAFEKDPADKLGIYTGGKSLRDDLTGGHWDFVTIHRRASRATTSRHIVRSRLNCAITSSNTHPMRRYCCTRRGSTGSMTRVSRRRHRNQVNPKSQDEMYSKLASAYAATAQELGLRRIPVAMPFHLANHDPQWGISCVGIALRFPARQTGGTAPTRRIRSTWLELEEAAGRPDEAQHGRASRQHGGRVSRGLRVVRSALRQKRGGQSLRPRRARCGLCKSCAALPIGPSRTCTEAGISGRCSLLLVSEQSNLPS